MLDFSDGWFMLPLRIVQLVSSLIGTFSSELLVLTGFLLVLVVTIAARMNLPNFVSTIHSPEIMMVGVRTFGVCYSVYLTSI